MGIHVSVNKEMQTVDMWMCVTSGCVRYEETKDSVYAGLEDRRKDGLRIEKSVALRKREKYEEFIHSIFNDSLPTVSDAPKADEEELIEAYKFVVEKVRRGMHYVGTKLEFTSPRGIRVLYRLRHAQKTDGAHIIVEMTAEKDGERISYQCFGYTSDAYAIIKEAAKAISIYILFSEYIKA